MTDSSQATPVERLTPAAHIKMRNPKILHRVYFNDMPPYRDPFGRFLDSWKREMPDYTIMHWNASNCDLDANGWVRQAAAAKSPVFLSEYFRWKALKEFGGVYLDADCEVLNGKRLHAIIDDVFASEQYDSAVGVEDFAAGHPTAQTMIAKPGSALVDFMVRMYDETLSGAMWHWREMRGFIGPQLISLFFMEHGYTAEKGMLPRLEEPAVNAGVKIYPQEYFSPKFAIDGKTLRYTENTCIYHLFANMNMPWTDETKKRLRESPALFSEYIRLLNPLKVLHRIYFGFDGKPDSCAGYLDTWKEQLPGYEVRHWNADNLPMDLNDYVRDLYAKRDHAFLTDYFRWWVLREYGGIYLDADVEIIDGAGVDTLIGELQEADGFDAIIGIDNKPGGWYTAHSMASKPGAAITKFMCRVYEEMGPLRAWRKKAFYLWAPQLTALYFFEAGHHIEGMGTSPHLDLPIVVARVKIYPQDYLSPIVPEKQENGDLFIINGYTERTVVCHHFACSWHDAESPYSSRAEGFVRNQNVRLRDLASTQVGGGVVQQQPDRCIALLDDGQQAADAGYWDEAEAKARQACEISPGNEKAWLQLGSALLARRRLDEAETALRRALFLDERSSPINLHLAAMLMLRGRDGEAMARLRYALDLDPNAEIAWAKMSVPGFKRPALSKLLAFAEVGS